jgi:hypothetical protein
MHAKAIAAKDIRPSRRADQDPLYLPARRGKPIDAVN